MKVLVTGSRGYIGSVMMKTLTELGHEAIGIDIEENPHGSTRYGNSYCININDMAAAELVVYNEIDTIFHFAASADVGLSVASPELFYYNNIGNTSTFINNLISLGWQGKFIFSSTAAVYKESQFKVTENDVLGSPNPYGKSKLACEWLLEDITKSHNIKVVAFRYFNVAGAWDDCGDHHNAGHIITRLCDAAYQNRPFTLNGTDKKTPDGTCIRDYLHVRDVCDAHLQAVSFLESNDGFHVFNLGTSTGWSNKNIIHAFYMFTSKKVEVINGPGRSGDPDHLVAHADKFVHKTGYRYTHSSLENIISTAWQYYTNKMEL